MSTVKSTENRIFNLSVAESALMVSMAGLQVFIVRFFFQGARKGTLVISYTITWRASLTILSRIRMSDYHLFQIVSMLFHRPAALPP